MIYTNLFCSFFLIKPTDDNTSFIKLYKNQRAEIATVRKSQHIV